MARRPKSAKSILTELNLDLKLVEPMTKNQEVFFNSYDEGYHQMLLGAAGSGKTFIALYKAMKDVADGKYRRVVIVRSAVPTREIGFLKGDENEKANIYTLPYRKIMSDLFGRGDAYELLVKHDVVRFVLTSYVRGLTVDDAVIVVDECQNLSFHEADSIITRVGHNTKIMFTGDLMQTDFTKTNEKTFYKFANIVSALQEFEVHHFTFDDIVRSGLVKSYIKTKVRLYGDDL